MRQRPIRQLAAFGCFLFTALAAGSVRAELFYVRAGGCDCNDGRTPETALATIGAAAALLANAGDRVIVGPGTYREGDINPAWSGIDGRAIEFLADRSGLLTGEEPGVVEIRPPPEAGTGFLIAGRHHIVIDGFSIVGAGDAGVQIRRAMNSRRSFNITVRNCEVRDSGKRGLDVQEADGVAIESNRVLDNGTTGISILGSVGAGAPLSSVRGNIVGRNGAHGVFVEAVDAVVLQGNVSFSNAESGFTLRQAARALVADNLVYVNQGDGIGVGTNDEASAEATIANNTVYANGNWGLVIGGSGVASAQSVVVNNIFYTNGRGGIAVSRSSTCGYVSGFNVHPDVYGPDTPASPYDINAAPVFVDPAGLDGVLGGQGSADDDFHLAQILAGQEVQSPGVDAGSAPIADIGLTGSTAASGDPDTGTIDVGYHYGADLDAQVEVPTPFMPLYVRSGGDDANEGKDVQNALATIAGAAAVARSGVTVVVAPGRYDEGDINPVQNGGRIAFLADVSGELSGEPPGTVLVDASERGTGFLLLQACFAVVNGFYVTGAADAGIQVRTGSDGSEVCNNVVFSNKRGIDVFAADNVRVVDNLVYANRTGGITVGATGRDENGSTATLIRSNTVYANSEGNGVFIGAGLPSPGARVEFNIFSANGLNGIQVGSGERVGESLEGYTARYNVNTDGYGAGTPRAATDLTLDPLFVDPSGPDGVLGGTGVDDDDFHLSQEAAGQGADSPAVDFAPFGTAAFKVHGRSTRTDGAPDENGIDIGFHYPRVVPVQLWVSPEGSDANPGTVESRPLATIAEAFRRAGEGTRIQLKAGTFSEAGLRPPAGVTVRGKVSGSALGSVVDAEGASTVFDVRSADVTLDRIVLSGADDAAVRVSADNFALVNCWAVDNAGKGVFLASGTNATVFNNVVAENGNTGIVVGGTQTHASGPVIAQNTVYANDNRGITVGLGSQVPSGGAVIGNNVIAESRAGKAGIEVGDGSAVTVSVMHNCNADGYNGIDPPDTSIIGDPLLLAPEQGDFHLAHTATGQTATSPCVDGGSGSVLQFGLQGSTTRSDGGADRGVVDIGYHYQLGDVDVNRVRRVFAGVPVVDCNGDGRLTVDELVRGVRIALGVALIDECLAFDQNGDGQVQVNELIFAVLEALR